MTATAGEVLGYEIYKRAYLQAAEQPPRSPSLEATLKSHPNKVYRSPLKPAQIIIVKLRSGFITAA